MVTTIDNMNSIKQQIREFIVEHFLLGDDKTLTDDASFLELGVVDSTGVLELVAHIEGTFGFKVADDELVPDNLDSIESLVAFIDRKTSGAPASPAA